ncbi:hypothetical protein ACWEGE_16695 [Amycolatopsis sp. NPDC004747]
MKILTIAAFFAIIVTGRDPRPLFEFTSGVLRWRSAARTPCSASAASTPAYRATPKRRKPR